MLQQKLLKAAFPRCNVVWAFLKFID